MSEPARLRITELFLSLQGESRTVGLPTVFIRLTGCPLRCGYCDTEYAFSGGEWRDIDEVVTEAHAYGVRHICVTGGEPLAQKGCLQLLSALCELGHEVSLETSGALDIHGVDARVSRVVDIKTPGSGEVAKNRWENLALLNSHDQLKFVISDRADYDWSRQVIEERNLEGHCELLFSPVHGSLEPSQLADWIVADRLPVRFQLQLHKLLWADGPGR